MTNTTNYQPIQVSGPRRGADALAPVPDPGAWVACTEPGCDQSDGEPCGYYAEADEPFSYVETEERTPAAYYENWAEVVDHGRRYDQPTVILRTIRTGGTGRSDARYIADRIASGLYWAQVVA